jgi:hypothetical protein
MDFFIGIEYDAVSNCYTACYSSGKTVQLSAANYHDAVLESDLIDINDYE